MARKLFFLVLALSLCGCYGLAQSKDYFRIARLSYLEGKVSFQHNDEVDWTAASINMALQPGDRIYTGDNGRAEIEFDDGSVLRLAEKTDVEILTMREELIQLKVLIGLCSLTGRSSVEFEINTPAAAFTTAEKGSYRFYIAENGDSDGIVRKGSMDAVNNRFSKHISGGEVLHVPVSDFGTEVLARYDQRDAWDEWTDRRNADQNAVESRRYIADTVYYGVSDLDRWGRWVTVDAYGPAWIPTVSMSWSPYWEGRWWYRPNWGWTWVSYEPWGWLPYHYGRWYNSPSFGWCWLPGPSFGFHFFSPGLVRFYRGADWISWCPLGPGDYYNVNNYYFNLRNRANVYYLNEMRLMQRRSPDDLINRRAQGAFRGVHTDQFVNGSLGSRVENRNGIMDPRQAGRIVTDNLDVRPTARSFAPAPERAVDRPNVKSRAVVVRTDPEFKSRGDRYIGITNPRISVPRARTEQQPSRVLSSQPSAGRTGAQDVPDRGGSASRTYQVPQSRSTTSTPQATQPRPAYRDTQVLQGQRQDPVQRSQQAPVTGNTSRMDPTPPSTRSYGSSSGAASSGGGYSTGSSSGGGYSSTVNSGGSSQSSAPARTVDRGSSPPPSSTGDTMSGRTGDGARTAPPTSSGSSAGSATTPVKKMPERPVASNYVPKPYQSPREYAPQRQVSTQVQSSSRQIVPSGVNDRSSSGNTSYYRSSTSVPPVSNMGRTVSVAPRTSTMRSASPQISAPRSASVQSAPSRSASMPSGAARSAPQRSAPASGSAASRRR